MVAMFIILALPFIGFAAEYTLIQVILCHVVEKGSKNTKLNKDDPWNFQVVQVFVDDRRNIMACLQTLWPTCKL